MKHASELAFALFLLILQPMLALADKAMPNVTLTGHTSAVIALAFSPDGSKLASAGDDGMLKLWDIAAKKELFTFNGVHNNRNFVRFTPDGQTVVSLGNESNVVLIDAKTGKPKPSIAVNIPGGPTAIDASPDGKTLAVVGRGTLRFFDLATSAQKAAYEVHAQHGVGAVAYSHDGSRVATAGDDHNATVIDTSTEKVVAMFDIKLNGEAVLFSNDAKTLYISSSDWIIRSFDIAGGQPQKLLEKGIPFLTVDLSHDGKSLVLGGVGRAPWLFSLADSKLIDDAFDSEDRTKSAALSPDGKWPAGGGNEGAIFLWKTPG